MFSLSRRTWLATLGGSVPGVMLLQQWSLSALAAQQEEKSAAPFTLRRLVPTRHYDGRWCWVHPRAGIVPGAGRDGAPRVVMTMNTLDVKGSDVFRAMYDMRSDDLGRTWQGPRKQPALGVRFEGRGDRRHPVALCDFWPCWHAATRTLLGTGHTAQYTPRWRLARPRRRHTAYAIYDARQDRWTPWQRLAMPPKEKFANAGAGCTQRVDLPDGTILLPIYFQPPNGNSRVTVLRCRFDGRKLTYVEHGDELAIADKTRGLHEPSLAWFQGQYFLTLRNDRRGYVTRSRDGLHFEPYRPWTFDDGRELGNYNTQQHWVVHSDALYLVYTRRGAGNDHVFRHRAPLFIAQVDPKRLCVLRRTERVLVPQRGARLGNFGVTPVSPRETWVTVSEWMQTWGPNYVLPVDNPHGADGSVYVVRILWEKPNRSFRS